MMDPFLGVRFSARCRGDLFSARGESCSSWVRGAGPAEEAVAAADA